MESQPQEKPDRIPLSQLRHCDRICDQFEAVWKAGNRPQLDDFLNQVLPDEQRTVLRQLMALDLDWRRRHGENPTLDTYRAEYPAIDFAPVADLFAPSPSAAPVEPIAGSDAELLAAGDIASTQARNHSAPRVGQIVAGRYKLLEEIGEGGMGSVFMAQQAEPVKRLVAVKIIKPGMDSKEVLARFEAERQALALMDHPNIARVLDAGATENGRPFFVMELVRGIPITRFCDERKLTVRRRLELFVPICHAIQHAHQKGIIHRDIKPSNVLVAMDNDHAVPKVIDFGLAKATGQTLTDKTLVTGFGFLVGTVQYMSPEQASLNNLDIDTRSDVYSLGVLLYELLTGRTPVERESLGKAALEEVLRTIREVDVPRPSNKLSGSDALPSIAANRNIEPDHLTRLIRRELDWVALKALEKDRARRYETANGLARDIQRYLADEAVEACPPSARYRLMKTLRRNKGPVLATTVVLLALLGGMTGATWGLLEARSQRDRAEAGEKLANDALVQVAAEKKKADEEIQIANSVREFLQTKLLGQADPRVQADTLRRTGRPSAEAKENPTIRELLDRAAKELAPERIDASFPNQRPLQAQILKTVGSTYWGVGDYKQAIGFLKRSAALFRQLLGSNDPITLENINTLALAYQCDGELDLALPLFEETLKLRTARLGPKHVDTLASMANLASAYGTAGKLDQALPLLEETVKLLRETLGPQPGTLVSMNNLGLAYLNAEKPDQALPLLEETVRLMRMNLGPDHPNTLQSTCNLALAYQAVGKLDLALSLLEKTLNLRKAKLGLDHPDTLQGMGNLAAAYQAAGKLDLALPLYKETLERYQAKLGPNHPDTLTIMANLASAYQDAGKLDLAQSLYEEALPRLEETVKRMKTNLGPDHPHTLATMDNLAGTYRAAGKLNLALPLFEETLKLRIATLGPNHRDVLANMNRLAVVYWQVKQLDKSIPLFEDLLKRQLPKLGRRHPDTLATVANLGVNYKDAGRLVEAVPLLEESYQAAKECPSLRWVGPPLLDEYLRAGKVEQAAALAKELLAEARTRLPKEGPELAVQLAEAVRLLLAAKAFADAEPLVRECLAIREKTQPDTFTTFNAKSMLGGALLGQKRYAEAEPLLLAGYEGMKQRVANMPPTAKLRLNEALERLIQVYEVLDKKDEAEKWRKELKAGKESQKWLKVDKPPPKASPGASQK